MFVTARFRDRLSRDDRGAVAIVVALVSLVLFGIAALAIDIGEMYSRRRASQTAADLAALAGVTALPDQTEARQRAYDYLDKNLPGGGPLPAIEAFSDGTLANGEILFPSTYKIRVVVPPRKVEFGFAGAMGFSDADVSAAATAEARSPAAAVPFYLTVGAQSGYSCLKDTSPGGGGGGGGGASAMRAALLAPGDRPPTITAVSPSTWSTLGGDTVTVTGTNFKNPAPDVSSVKVDGVEVSFWTIVNNKTITLSSPVHLATGSATLTVTNTDGTASFVVTYAEPPPTAAPTVTALSPTSGPETGGTTVTITGTGFDTASAVAFGSVPATEFTVESDTEIEAVAPPGTGLVNVLVTNPGGTSTATTANEYTYQVDACAGTTGSFGYLDIPRGTDPDPSGTDDTIIVNTIKGIDHSWETYPHDVPLGTECRSGVTLIEDAVLDNGNGVDGANCLDIENGNKVSAVGEAFLDGWDKFGFDLEPRLDAPAGHDSVTIMGRNGMDGDHISDYLTVPLATFVAKLADPTPDESEVSGWIKSDILACPRFAIVPVLNVDENPPNGFYPIVGFAGVFLDGPAPDYGFSADSVTGSQVKSIRAYAFSLNYLPGIVSSGTTAGTVTFLGTGPKVPVLVHDSGDPSY